MKVYYYFDWFNEEISKEIVQALRSDVVDRKSIVFIGAEPKEAAFNDEQSKIAKGWLGSIGIEFEEYHLLDYRISKEEGLGLICKASAVFFLGGFAVAQRDFLEEYEIGKAVKESEVNVVMGVSAGAMNMSGKWIRSRFINPHSRRYTAGETQVFDGLGFHDFMLEPHFEAPNNTLVKNDLMPLSKEVDVYVACYESAIRVKGDEMTFFGEIYRIVDEKLVLINDAIKG